MTDAEISRLLALAIGWEDDQMEESAVCDGVILPSPDPGENYRVFDYRDPSVIWPIAERFNCFPVQCTDGEWVTDTDYIGQDTAAKAVALAVIRARQGAKE